MCSPSRSPLPPCHVPLSHHVTKPELISWCFFPSNNENQAEVIPTKNKKHTNAKPFLRWTGHCNQRRIHFFTVDVSHLLLLCAHYNRVYCIEWSAQKPSKIA